MNKEQFEALRETWYRETCFHSSITVICAHRAYLEIVAAGAEVVPWMFADLVADKPYFWFHALRVITGANPVPPKHAGRYKAMTNDWLAWGRRNGYLPS